MSRTRRRNGETELRTPDGWRTRKQAPQRWDSHDAEQESKSRRKRDRERMARVQHRAVRP